MRILPAVPEPMVGSVLSEAFAGVLKDWTSAGEKLASLSINIPTMPAVAELRTSALADLAVGVGSGTFRAGANLEPFDLEAALRTTAARLRSGLTIEASTARALFVMVAVSYPLVIAATPAAAVDVVNAYFAAVLGTLALYAAKK